MSRSKNLVKNFFKDLSSEKKAVEFPGFLGNHAGTIKADDYGNVWVILFNGKQVKVRNNVAPLVPRTPVVVGYSKDDPKLLQVLRVWNVYDRNTEPYLPPHAKTHTWPGADTVNIREEQFLPGLALPAGDMTVQFYGWYYKIAGQWYLAPAQLIDLASYVPASGAIWVSVEIDAAGDITYVESDSQDNRYLLTLADIPETPKTRALLFAVKCYAGQTEVIKSEILNDIFNPRMAYSAAESVEWGDIGGTVTNQTDLVSYIDSRLVGLWDDRGNYDASGGAYPSSGGSGTAGAILKGDIWTISVAGTLPTGQAVEVGDTVRALVNAPGNTQANWAISQNNIGYVAENSANKTDTMAGNESSSTKYLSAKGVYDWAISTFQAALGYTAENSANKTSTITGNESSTTLYSTIKGIVDWVKQGLTGVLPSKTTPVDGDSVLINDSADSNKTKLTTWSNIKATLKSDSDGIGWQLIEDKLLGADTASFDFQNIPTTFKHLKILIQCRSDRASNEDVVMIKLNNDSGNNYVGKIQWTNSSSVYGSTEQATAGGPVTITFCNANSATTGYRSNTEITLFDYANANAYKTFQGRGFEIATSGGNVYIYDAGGMYLSNTAISRVTIYPLYGTNFKQYSRATLFGMK